MAEFKSNFLKSKMNKDLDARIIPPGEYRDALNVAISKSEDDNVGALENLLGNLLVTDFNLDSCTIKCIGHLMDVVNDRIFVFLTNYTDSSADQLSNSSSGYDLVESYIAYYDIKRNIGEVIVGGSWLNFSQTHFITGVNILEDLLFWTDNRNQPRKINVNTAINDPYIINPTNPSSPSSIGYYFNEDHVSVAKYYPFECMNLYEGQTIESMSGGFVFLADSGLIDRTSEWLPIHAIATVDCTGGCSGGGGGGCTGPNPPFPNEDKRYIQLSTQHTIGSGNNIQIGDRISGYNVAPDSELLGPWTTVISVDNTTCPGTVIRVENYNRELTLQTGDILYFQRANPNYDPNFKGDPDFFKDKFARFSYRFKFDDGEYSLIAPFTQITFVPIQDGYFIGDNAWPNDAANDEFNQAPGQESETYRSSVVNFMENKVSEVKMNIPPPRVQDGDISWLEIFNRLKVVEIDILWKSATDQSIKVIETLKRDYFENGDNYVLVQNSNNECLNYNYKSYEPWKTLPTSELTRVYDKVPVKALSQEVAGNRVMYGNFVDKHTSPPSLDYLVNIDEKPELTENINDTTKNVRIEYQNHTLKQNRTYQVGVVLSDRYGRQSDVILSNLASGVGGKASTIYHEYRDIDSKIITDAQDPTNPSNTWPGDMLTTIWNSTIPSVISDPGYPGLYSINDGSIAGAYDLQSFGDWGNECSWTVPINIEAGIGAEPVDPPFVSFETDASGNIILDSLSFSNTEGLFSCGDFVTTGEPEFSPGFCPIYTDQRLEFFAVCNEDNPLGWYSYKIVVKQTEQEYYNVYLPGMLRGYPRDINGQDGDTTASPNVPSVTEKKFPKGENFKTAFSVLINDNINKIPRDLIEVGPEQSQFRSSVKLFGRVENTRFETTGDLSLGNKNYQPDTLGDIVNLVGQMTELGLGSFSKAGAANLAYSFGQEGSGFESDENGPLIPPQFYNGGNNPVIAKISTRNAIGWYATQDPTTEVQYNMLPFLSVYETAPVESKLDIYWETSTSGLISELNELINTQDDTFPASISNPDIIIREQDPSLTVISADFWAQGPTGTDLDDPIFGTTIALSSVRTSETTPTYLTQKFELVQVLPNNRYRLRTAQTTDSAGTPTGEYLLSYEDNAKTTLIFEFIITQVDGSGNVIGSINVESTGNITNFEPLIRGYQPNDIKDRAYKFVNSQPNGLLPGCGSPPINSYSTSYMTSEVPDLYRAACGPLIDGSISYQGTPMQWGNNYLCPFDDSSYNPNLNGYKDRYYNRLYSGNNGSFRGRGYLRGVEGVTSAQPDECFGGWTYSDWKEGDWTPDKSLFFDGTFEATNGIYGSDAVVFGDSRTCWEVEWSVPRQYQVSAIVGWHVKTQSPFPSTSIANSTMGWDPYNIVLPSPGFEYVFGRDWCMYNNCTGANDCALQPVYDLPYNNNYINPAIPYGTNITNVLTGPVYLDPYPNALGIPDPTNTTVAGNFGEATVGEKYNSGKHYWVDLDYEKDSAVSWASNLTNIINQPDGLPGSWGITLFQTEGVNSWAGKIDDEYRFRFHHGGPTSPQQGYVDSNNQGYYDSNTINNTSKFNQFQKHKFFAESLPGACPNHSTAKGRVGVNEFMHPGRYVVTLRATDKNGSGLFVEWDLPVYIPETWDPNRSRWGNTTSSINCVSCSVTNGPSFIGPSYCDFNSYCE